MTASPRTIPLPALLLLLCGCLGFAAAWVLASLALETHGAWLAPLAALDALLMLKLGHATAGWRRATIATCATATTILIANWGIAATEIGRSMGLLPWDSALRLGPAYAWELIRLANGTTDLAWYALALVVALIGGLSGRRPVP
ncbi:hypothetical protein [Thermomonas sp. HDW16]|uniref:hypothetical protein n=1 Tax=Thermomonas sp. HDW16 TaxID=2714945 RepID=UPI001408E3BE|nr:hypothetical protein [Thermomonas sp. HDW16]QIL21307.1 hypothetical protein G7079_11510 [Thermomonas sp. HDW16]